MSVSPQIDSLDKRIHKTEELIDKLTDISNSISKLLAVQEQRIMQQEKESTGITIALEKRREEIDNKIKEVYTNISKQEQNLSEEMNEFRKEMNEQYKVLSNKITQLERFNWITVGGAIVISWIISYIVKYAKIF